VERAHALAARLGSIAGCEIANDGPFFDRFALRVPGGGFRLRWALLREARIIGGDATLDHYEGRDDLILQCTEMTTDTECDALVDAVERAIVSTREAVPAR
jgi:glycine cleavage system pyridoxal-binding protein P